MSWGGQEGCPGGHFLCWTLGLGLGVVGVADQGLCNVRWSHILFNCMPTGATSNTEATSPDKCHDSLLADNPLYATLTITQCPSWVKDPSSYFDGSVSFLSFAFEDPNGLLAAKLLFKKELYIFSTNATVKKWKQKTPPKKPTQPLTPFDTNPQNPTIPPETMATGKMQSSQQGLARPGNAQPQSAPRPNNQ